LRLVAGRIVASLLQLNRKRHLKAASTATGAMLKVVPVTSSGGDYFDYREHSGIKSQRAAQLRARIQAAGRDRSMRAERLGG
jgi:hypothetical protein